MNATTIAIIIAGITNFFIADKCFVGLLAEGLGTDIRELQLLQLPFFPTSVSWALYFFPQFGQEKITFSSAAVIVLIYARE